MKIEASSFVGLKGKYSKQVLLDIERNAPLDPEVYKVVRKAVLDGFNDLQRELLKPSTKTDS